MLKTRLHQFFGFQNVASGSLIGITFSILKSATSRQLMHMYQNISEDLVALQGKVGVVVTNGTSLLFVRSGLLLLEGGPGTNIKGKRNSFLTHPPTILREQDNRAKKGEFSRKKQEIAFFQLTTSQAEKMECDLDHIRFEFEIF